MRPADRGWERVDDRLIGRPGGGRYQSVVKLTTRAVVKLTTRVDLLYWIVKIVNRAQVHHRKEHIGSVGCRILHLPTAVAVSNLCMFVFILLSHEVVLPWCHGRVPGCIGGGPVGPAYWTSTP